MGQYMYIIGADVVWSDMVFYKNLGQIINGGLV